MHGHAIFPLPESYNNKISPYPDELAPGEQVVDESAKLDESDWKSVREFWPDAWVTDMDHKPGVSFVASSECPVESCCSSAVAFLRLNLLKRDDFLLILSSRLALDRDFASPVFRASFMAWGSLLLPPVLMDVVSSAAARRDTASPPEMRSCKTWVWNNPWTGSPLMCVTRSPGRSPGNQMKIIGI